MELTIPCAYQGGKQRIAKEIVDVIYRENEINDDTKFYDLCCGSGAVSIEMVKRGFDPNNIIMVDKSPWGLFWKKIGDGTFSPEVFRFYLDDIPKDITKIKDHAQQLLKEPANDGLFDNMVYKFLILQACAFGATATWVENNQWKKSGGLRNYWLPTETSNRKSPVNPMMPMPETLFKRVEHIACVMDGVNGFQSDISKAKIEMDNSIIYIDPPYKDTSHYGYDFNYMEYIKGLKNRKVYLSEGIKVSNIAHLISGSRKKGGINGERKSSNEEWLNIFN
jgi:site-specific DNA-adenine methylase